MVAPRDWGDGLRRRVKAVRCRPVAGGWLIQVLDGEGRVMAERTAMVSRMEQVRDLLAEDEVRLGRWRKIIAHGVEWLGEARMLERF